MKREIIRVEGPCSAGCIAFSASLHLYRARGSAFRSHEMEILGLPIASAPASLSPRSEHRLPSDNSAKTRRPGLIGSAEPHDGQMARISGPAIQQEIRSDEHDRSEWQRGRLF